MEFLRKRYQGSKDGQISMLVNSPSAQLIQRKDMLAVARQAREKILGGHKVELRRRTIDSISSERARGTPRKFAMQ